MAGITGALLLTMAPLSRAATTPLPDAPDAPRLAQAQTQAAPKPQTAPAAQQGNQGGGQKPAADYSLESAEHQRIFGIIPEFQAVNTTGPYKPLTVGQKFNLMFKSSTDPYVFALDIFVAGIGQAEDSNPGFGQGAAGYFKRYGASLADTIDGNFWGNAVLTSAFKEDPRYFRKGEGFTAGHRALYSATTAVWCKRDSGKWGPNYANVLGNLIGGGISNAYYPAADRGVENTFTGAITVTAEGIIGSELEEFWPDIERHFNKKHQQKLLQQQAATR